MDENSSDNIIENSSGPPDEDGGIQTINKPFCDNPSGDHSGTNNSDEPLGNNTNSFATKSSEYNSQHYNTNSNADSAYDDSYNRISPENNQLRLESLQESVPNSAVKTHLESNLNVIENQNNENHERDNDLSGINDSDPENHEEEEILQEESANNEDCDTNDNVADSAPDFSGDDADLDPNLDTSKLDEPSKNPTNSEEPDSIETPVSSSETDIENCDSIKELSKESDEPNADITKKRGTDSTEIDSTKDDTAILPELSEKAHSSFEPSAALSTSDISDVIEPNIPDTSDLALPNIQDRSTNSSDLLNPSQETSSEQNELDSNIVESEGASSEKHSKLGASELLDTSLDENAIDDIPREPLLEFPEKDSEKTPASSKQTSDENIEFAHVNFDTHEKETEDHESEKDSSNLNKDVEYDPIASDNAEHVDASDNAEPTDDNAETADASDNVEPADASDNVETADASDNVETADSSDHTEPVDASDIAEPADTSSDQIPEPVEPVEEGAGADEDLTIIPDTERELTQAEKDAASSLPPLKELSDYPLPAPSVDSDDEVTYVGEKAGEVEAAPELDIQPYTSTENETHICVECKETKEAKFSFKKMNGEEVQYLCETDCMNAYKAKNAPTKPPTDQIRVRDLVDKAPKLDSTAFVRTCASCSKVTDDIENNLTWEIMDFCNEYCLSKYQKVIGSKCASCRGDVKPASLGKYCVRFGNDIRQFCTSACLEEYKKGLKVCSYCQQDMSNRPDGFLAPVGEKGLFKDFCSKLCMEKYDIMTNDRPPKVAPDTKCSVCNAEKQITIEFEHNDTPHYFCGEPCFVAFSFVNQLSAGKCAMCRRHFRKSLLEQNTMYYDNVQYSFCSNSCKNIYIIAHRKIVPCSWCKVKKYNFDMIKKYGKNSTSVINMCSINCLSLYKVSLTVINSKASACHFCQKTAHPAYHLTMSDASVRNFCCYNCVMSFQNQFPKQIAISDDSDSTPVPTGVPQKNKKISDPASVNDLGQQMPVIANVKSLAASTNGSVNPSLLPPGLTPISASRLTRSQSTAPTPTSAPSQPSVVSQQSSMPMTNLPINISADLISQFKQHFIIKPPKPPEQKNAATQAQPKRDVKCIQTKPDVTSTGMQTDKEEISRILIPVPIPVYVPTPCHMFSTPVPIPVPFPLPIPIPIFIPTTRNSSAGIMKEIKKIQVKIPTDPYEAELLMMAEMVAGEKKEENTDSESDLDDGADDNYSPEPVDSSNTFGDDMLQMALKMATELDEPAVDLEGALTANTITAQQGGHQQEPPHQEEHVDDPQPMHPHMMDRNQMRGGRKRGIRGGATRGQSKRGRRMSHQQVDMPMHPQMQQPPPPPEPQEKPDANMCLKYTFGVNAWKQWVTTKNAELEKSSRRLKLFKTEILQLTADELNYSLCLFVKEVRKPNGQEYAPDTIYYLCLGIQQYLFENGRIDNIFCDPYYEKFTDCLDEVAKKFSVLYNDSHYIVTRVEEEHLWESKQLGAHSPHVLLSTLMFFNTKHFNLTSVDEHMQLSFSHIMKHWKRNPNQPGASKVPGSRNVLLRFYPPQSAIQNNQRKKKVYEQQENEENPLRCPVKLYEFYLSKCPESVKTRNDVFYLQPERSCVPDSPVWYSTMPLPKEALEKMLHRVKMVKEINVALLTS